MDDGVLQISAGGLTTLIVELIKLVVRFWKPGYDFPAWAYALGVPLINTLMPYALFALGVIKTDPILTMDMAGVTRYLLLVVLASAVSFIGYNKGLKPLYEYRDSLNKSE